MAAYVFRNDEAFLAEYLDRTRRVGFEKYLRGSLKLVCLAGLLLLLSISAYAAIWPLAGISMLLIVILGIGPRIDYFFARRRLRKSVLYNQDIHLAVDANTLISTYSTGRSESNWKPFRRFVRLDDGFLVFFESKWPAWWPDDSIKDGSVDDVAHLLKTIAARELPRGAV